MFKFVLTLFIFLIPFSTFFAQQTRTCASNDYLQYILSKDPTLYSRYEQAERLTLVDTGQSFLEPRNKPVIIPVVIHVLYNVGSENISDEQINSQIDVLNADYRKKNTDALQVPAIFIPLAADCLINFHLANVDPSGRRTSGIERIFTSQKSWNTDDAMKFNENGGTYAWDAANYLNIWICNLNGGVMGYSTFPGSSTNVDGVVIDYRFFGTTGTVKTPFSLGRTTTHEIGHYFNLKHIWGDSDCGDDFVADTPQQAHAFRGTPSFPQYGVCNGNFLINMSMNFMDYVNDAAMHLFTLGQFSRVQATLNPGGPRASLIYSKGYDPSNSDVTLTATAETQSPTECEISTFPNPANDRLSIRLSLSNSQIVRLSLFDVQGRELKFIEKTFYSGKNNAEFDLSELKNGIYILSAKAADFTVPKKVIIAHN